ncbi:MAG: DUF421 domain-containing protein [Clostridia bacterium]|nr:DUF421 domain-containing protein [Clostridia bacterium]
MIVTFFRTLIILITLIVLMRLMGKRQIGEMQPFEFIVTLIIADLACIPMADVSIPLLYGIVAIICVFLLHQILALLEQRGNLLKRIISGKPSLVINKDGVDMLELKRNNMDVGDLIESMRSAGYFSLDDVNYAIFESNGKLSTMAKENRTQNPSSVPLLIVSDGKADKKNLELIKITNNDIDVFLSSNNTNLKNTEVMTVDGDGRVYLKVKKQKFKILQYSLPQGVKW